MTILPKKKQNRDKEHRNEARDRSNLAQASSSGSNISYFDENSSLRRPRQGPNLGSRAAEGPRLSPSRGLAPSGGIRKQRSNVTSSSSSHSRHSVASKTPSSSVAEKNNSEDEYEPESKLRERSDQPSDELERQFEESLKPKGLILKQMATDGACLFRAVADQVYGDAEMHGTVRKLCMDYIEKNNDYFSQYITEDFGEYIARKRLDHVHGNHVEMQAMAEVFARPILVYQYSTEPMNTFQTRTEGLQNAPIRVSYHGGVHYNSIVDPYAATIGVGLGLPQFYPGMADKNLLLDAVRKSENETIEQAMLEDKLKATDWEATDEQIQEQVARESYLKWIKEQEKDNAPCHSRSLPKNNGSNSPKYHSPKSSAKPQLSPLAVETKANSPKNVETTAARTTDTSEAGSSSRAVAAMDVDNETAGLMTDLPPSAFGLDDYGAESDIMAQILALSQQEYFESLKKNNQSASDSTPPISQLATEAMLNGQSATEAKPLGQSATETSAVKETDKAEMAASASS